MSYKRPRSPLDDVDVSGPLRELRRRLAAGETVLQLAVYVAFTHELLPVEPWEILDAGAETERYTSAANAKNWPEADRIYMEALLNKDPLAFQQTLETEGWARALNVILDENFDQIDVLWRWISPEEVQSYSGGTFESRVEEDGGRRGFKALSIGPNAYSMERSVYVIVQIDENIRRVAVRPDYTALPRPLESHEERLGDGKHIKYAGETEWRLPDGTRVPRGTRMFVKLGTLDPTDRARLISACDLLHGVMEVSFIDADGSRS